jgi:hypothetical protein
MNGPTDGYAYNRIELAYLDDLVVDVGQTHFQSDSPLALRYKYFKAAASWLKNPNKDADREKEELIKRALLAEYDDPAPKDAPLCDGEHLDGGHNDR